MAARKKSKEQSAADQGKYIIAVCADTIYRISRAYNVPLPEIKKLNPGIATAFIRKGTQVRIR